MITITKKIDLEDFDAWSGAIDTIRIVDQNRMMEELEELVIEWLGISMTATELNDFLWFEDEFIFQSLGINTDEDEEEEEDE